MNTELQEQVWPRVAATVVLTCHLAYFFAMHVFAAYLFMGYALERQASLGEPATPTYIWGISQFVAFILFALTLYLVIKKSRVYLVAGAIASIGGYLVSQLVVVFVLQRDTPFLDLQPQDLLSWGLPFVTVVLYHTISELLGQR